ncbi:MAG: hypothetical protein WBN04_13055 [Paracoccaceae bacterium]
MIGAIRLAVFGFLFLAVVYLLVSVYSRSIRREKLEEKWDNEIKTGDRDAYIAAGMQDYEAGFRKKLIVLVIIVPILVVGGLLYAVNFM